MKEAAEKLVEIEQLAAMVADQDVSLRHAMVEVRDEGAKILKTMVEMVRSALPMICSAVALAVDAPYEKRHQTAPVRVAPWKGFRIVGNGPSSVSGARLGMLGGSAIYLREDGTFVRVEYTGHEGERFVWQADFRSMTATDVALVSDIGEILSVVGEGLTQQLAGRKDEHTEVLLATAEKYRAISTLLKGVA